MTGRRTDRLHRHRVVITFAFIVLVFALLVLLIVQHRMASRIGEEAPVSPVVVAQVAAPAATRVTRVLVDAGDRVRAGQALIILDVSVFAAQTRVAQAALKAASLAYERSARLAEQGILPQKDAETAAAALAKARTDLEVASRTQALSTLRAPIAGIMTRVFATVSKPADPLVPLVEIADLNGLEVLFHLSPVQADSVKPGAAVQIRSDPDSVFAIVARGVVRGVSAALDSTGRVEVRSTIAHSSRTLKVGEVVAGRIVVAVHPRAVVVPVSALVATDSGFTVFIVDAQQTAHARRVIVGQRNETIVEIRKGLHGGETIVTAGAYGVTDSARIQRVRIP